MTNTPLPSPQTPVALSTAKAMMPLLWALGIAAFLVGADNRAVTPVLPAIAADLGVRESMAGLLVTAYSLPYGLFQLVYGPIADRIGKLRTIAVALFLFALGTIACGLVSGFSALFTLRVVTGMFAAGIIPISLAQIGDRFPLEDRPKALATFMSLSTSGVALGVVLGGVLAEFVTWKMVFVLLGLAGLPSVLLLLRELKKEGTLPPPPPMPLRERYRRLLSNRRAWLVYGAVCLEGMLFFGGFTYLGVYAFQDLGLSYLMSGLLTVLFSVGTILASRMIVRVLRRVGSERMPVLGALLMVAGYGTMWTSATVPALCVGLLLHGFGYSFLHTTLQGFATELLPEARATAMSFFAFFLFTGTGLGPIWFGWIYDAVGSRGMLLCATIALFVYALLVAVLFQKKKLPAQS